MSSSRFLPAELRREVGEYSDPAGDAGLWPEFGYMYEEWGWYGDGGDSCPVCGLKTRFWLPDEQRPEEERGKVYMIATGWQPLEQRFHWQSVCGKRCEDWDAQHNVFDIATPNQPCIVP